MKEEKIEEEYNNILRDNQARNISGKSNEEQKRPEERIEQTKTTTDQFQKEKQNSQLRLAVFLMLAVLLIIVLIPYIKLKYIDKFKYNGLEFQKTKLGELVFYSAKFPVISTTGQVIGDYAVNLRNDPRDLEYVEINTTDNQIKFARNYGDFGTVYLSLGDQIADCEDSIIAMANLAGFLGDSGLEIKSAVLNKTYAQENNQTFINCWDSDINTVIKIQQSNKTSIKEAKENCYEINFKDCEILQASEKFQLLILGEYADRFSEDN